MHSPVTLEAAVPSPVDPSNVPSAPLPAEDSSRERSSPSNKLSKIGMVGILSTLSLFGSSASGQEKPEVAPPAREGTIEPGRSNNPKPEEKSCHQLVHQYETKHGIFNDHDLFIHAGEGVAEGSEGPYFLYPQPFMIHRSPDRPLQGVPPIIHDIQEALDGTNNLVFTLYTHVANQQLLDLAAKSLEVKWKGSGPFEVRQWPVTGVVIEAWVNGSRDEPLAVTYRDGIAGKDNFSFALSLGSQEVDRLLQAYKNGSLNFTYHFHYDGAFESSLRHEASLSANASSKLMDIVESRRWIEDGEPRPLLAHEKQELDDHIESIYKEQVTAKIRGQGQGILALYDASVAQTLHRITDPGDLVGPELAAQLESSSFQEALRQRLEPLVNRTYQSTENKDVTVEVKQAETVFGKGKATSFGLMVQAASKAQGIGGGMDFGLDRQREEIHRVLDRIERETGVTYVESSEKSVYVPEKIAVWRLVDLDRKRNVFYESVKTVSVDGKGYLGAIDDDLSFSAEALLYDPQRQPRALTLQQQETAAAYKNLSLEVVDNIQELEEERDLVRENIASLQIVAKSMRASIDEYISTFQGLSKEGKAQLSEYTRAQLAQIDALSAPLPTPRANSESAEESEEKITQATLAHLDASDLRAMVNRMSSGVERQELQEVVAIRQAENAQAIAEREAILTELLEMTHNIDLFTKDYIKLKGFDQRKLMEEQNATVRERLAVQRRQARLAWEESFLAHFNDRRAEARQWLTNIVKQPKQEYEGQKQYTSSQFQSQARDAQRRGQTANRKHHQIHFFDIYEQLIASQGPMPQTNQ